jgi:hypothetical protein
MSNIISTKNVARMEPLEDRRLFATFMVTNTNDAGGGSLRQAMIDANNTGGTDSIKFNIGYGAKTIMPTSELPRITSPVVIDGSSQPGYTARPIIEINGSRAGSGFVNGIRIDAGRSTVRGLVINRFAGSGIFLYNQGNNTVVNCYLGVDANGSGAAGNGAHGILVQSPNNTIGGTWWPSTNIISGNGQHGIQLYTGAASGTRILGNFIGTDRTGSYAIGNNNSGVAVNGAAYNQIGGTDWASHNVISGNRYDGIVINQDGAKHNNIWGNYIGTNAAGNGRVGNGQYGVEISQSNNYVGGNQYGMGNVISANGLSGVVLWLGSAYGNVVQGNYVGTDSTGTRDLGNITRGVELSNGANNNWVGGSTWQARNVISGNDQGGIGIYSGSNNNTIKGNYIGTNTSGSGLVSNGVLGIILTDGSGSNTLITQSGWRSMSNGVLPDDRTY